MFDSAPQNDKVVPNAKRWLVFDDDTKTILVQYDTVLCELGNKSTRTVGIV